MKHNLMQAYGCGIGRLFELRLATDPNRASNASTSTPPFRVPPAHAAAHLGGHSETLSSVPALLHGHGALTAPPLELSQMCEFPWARIVLILYRRSRAIIVRRSRTESFVPTSVGAVPAL